MRETEVPTLNVNDVSVGYGRTEVLTDTRLEVGEGEIVALIGPNGAGKTTLLNTISGLLRPRSGHIGFGSHRLERMPPDAIVRAGVSQVPEGRRIFAELSVDENLVLGGYAVHDPAKLRSARELVFDLFPILSQRSRQSAGTLSGGEQQMLAIGRALVGNPSLLMLDEPSLGLAPLVVRQIYETFNEIVQSGTSLLLVEQNARIALKAAAHAYVLEHGHIVMEGDADALAASDRLQSVYLGGHVGGAEREGRSDIDRPVTPGAHG